MRECFDNTGLNGCLLHQGNVADPDIEEDR